MRSSALLTIPIAFVWFAGEMIKKLLCLIAAGVIMIVSEAHAAASCSAVDFTSSSSKSFITSLNSAVDNSKSKLTALLASKDPYPLEFNNKTLDLQTVPFFGYSFTLTPMLSHVSVTGFKNIVARQFKATSSKKVDIGAGSLLGALDGLVAHQVAP